MTDPWEEHADWWQREFTNGADPEYTEQILPLIQQHLPRSGQNPLIQVSQLPQMITSLKTRSFFALDTGQSRRVHWPKC